MLLTGCVGSEDKKYVRETLSAYFAALNAGEYEKANAYTVRAEEDIYEDIDDESVNDVIFENISYEIWSIDKEGDFLIAEVVIGQLSIKTAYIDAVKEYALSIGAYHITLNVWTCNPSAIAFYESIGLSKMEYIMEEILWFRNACKWKKRGQFGELALSLLTKSNSLNDGNDEDVMIE